MEPRERLAEKISHILRSGIELSCDTLAYIDSTLSYPTAQEIEAILLDKTDGDRDSLLELIFFPDEALQRQIESLLEASRFTDADQYKLARLLSEKHIVATIRFADGRPDIRLCVPDEVLDSLVSKLHITLRLPPALIERIDRSLPEAGREAVKVCLRNHRRPLTPNQADFVGNLIEALAGEADLIRYLEFALQLLGAAGEPDSWYDLLVERRRALEQDLKKSERYRTLLHSDNFETMMMRGLRIPLIDVTSIKRQIVMIDAICFSVFGKVDPPILAADAEAPIECRTRSDLKRIVRRLS